MTLPVPVLLHLYDVRERARLEDRAASTGDNIAVTGSHSREHWEAVRERIALFEQLAAGEAGPPGYTGDTPERIEL